MTQVLTSGYQGESLENFVSKLVAARIDVLVDVRTFASSRKPGFSKRALEQALQSRGIDYMHMPQLGMPRHLLRQRHELSDNTPILDAYDDLLPEWGEHLDSLMTYMHGKRSCLMCFEADEQQCHRSRLACYLQARYPEISLVACQAEHPEVNYAAGG